MTTNDYKVSIEDFATLSTSEIDRVKSKTSYLEENVTYLQNLFSELRRDVDNNAQTLNIMNADMLQKVGMNFEEVMYYYEIVQEELKKAALKEAQEKNKRLRSLIQNVQWNGTACIMHWNDGTQTKAVGNDEEDFDPEKALLVCIGRKFYQENPNVLSNMLDKYTEAGWEHYNKNLVIKKDDDDIWWMSI